MKKEELIKKAEMLGFPLLKPEAKEDVNKTLSEVIKSKNSRLWEGFPVMLANAAQSGDFRYKSVLSLLKKVPEKEYFKKLLSMSLSLYRHLGMDFDWMRNLQKEYGELLLGKDATGNLVIGGHVMSMEKLSSLFKAYSHSQEKELNDFLSAREESGLEYAMSQIFTPRQKELFFKKLRQEKLTKTESEYFSRVIKKKILALSNAELHGLARKIIEQ